MSASRPQDRPGGQDAQPEPSAPSARAGDARPDRLERELRRMAVLHGRALRRARRGVATRTLPTVAVRRSR